MISLKQHFRKDFSVILPLIFILATLLRVLFLDIKPTHFDEGVNGWFVEQIKANGVFDYNPENFHGPLYFYILYLFDVIFGSEIYVHRFVPAICSIGAMFIFYKSMKLLSQKNIIGLLALAVSPGIVFYARYSIHESLLLFGFSLWLYGCLRLLTKTDSKSIWFLCISFIVMATTKETFIILVINTVIALAIVRFWQKRPLLDKTLNVENIYLPVTALILLIVFFYSELFTSFGEVKEFFSAFSLWKATGFKHTGHEKIFFYWLGLFLRYEWIFLVGFILSILKLFSKDKVQQFLAVYAFGNLLAFSLISYKTPWCILVLLFPYAFFLQSSKKLLNVFFCITVAAMCVHSIQLNFIDYANPKEAYVYVQTSPKMKDVVDPLRAWIKMHPDDKNIKFLIQTSSEWPLPWLLKDYKRASYVHVLPADWATYDLIIVDRSVFDKTVKTEALEYLNKDFQIRYEQEASVFLISHRREDLVSLFGGKH